GAGRTQGDQLVGIHGDVAGIPASEVRLGRAVLHEIAGHPVVFASAGEVLYLLAPIAAMELGAAFTGGTDQHHRKARVECHRDESSLAVTGHTLDPDTRGVNAFIGFEVVETS